MKCKVCSRGAHTQPPANYCELHHKAYETLQDRFEVWKKASSIEWKDYLQEVVKNPLTGSWAKEVAQNLLADEH